MNKPGPFEIMAHTADVGLRVRGGDRKKLFTNAAAGMMSIITDSKTVAPAAVKGIEIEAEDFSALLVAWLNEIIFLIEAHGMLFSRFRIDSLTDTELVGRVEGEPLDQAKHQIKTEIKACTYHELKTGKDKSGWFAQVIFDV